MNTIFAALSLALALLASTITALVVPEDKSLFLSSAARMSAENMTIVDMTVTDDRFPGVTFTGTAQSVYEMKGLKPEAFPDDINIFQARSLAKRSTLNCDYGTDILGSKSCENEYNYLKGLDRANCCVSGPASTCARVSCSYKCGVFLCNKTNGQLCVACGDIATDQRYIMDNCYHVPVDTAGGARDFDTRFIGQSGTHGC